MNRFKAAWKILIGKADAPEPKAHDSIDKTCGQAIIGVDPDTKAPWTQDERLAYLSTAKLGDGKFSRLLAQEEVDGVYWQLEHYKRPDNIAHYEYNEDRIHRPMQRALSKPPIISQGKWEIASNPSEEVEVSTESQIPVEETKQVLEPKRSWKRTSPYWNDVVEEYTETSESVESVKEEPPTEVPHSDS